MGTVSDRTQVEIDWEVEASGGFISGRLKPLSDLLVRLTELGCPKPLKTGAQGAIWRRRRGKDQVFLTFVEAAFQIDMTADGRATRRYYYLEEVERLATDLAAHFLFREPKRKSRAKRT